MPFIVLPDDYKGYNPEFFCIPKHYEGALECVLVPGGTVKDRIERLARDIAEDMGSEPIVALCVLKGGYKFFTDLLEQVKLYNHYVREHSVRISVDFIRLKSYEDDHSSGKVRIIGIDDLNTLKGKNVLIVEDVIDTGHTIKQLLKLLEDCETKTVKVASLIVKRTQLNQYRPDYCGFEVADKFVVGYAIDYNEYFRDLNKRDLNSCFSELNIWLMNNFGMKSVSAGDRDCIDQLLLRQIFENKITCFMDFKKAFDTVDYEIIKGIGKHVCVVNEEGKKKFGASYAIEK